MLKRC